MGRLYDACQQVQAEIDARGLDAFKTRGAFALQTGFLFSLVAPDEPDDPQKLADLRDAAKEILGMDLKV